MAGPDVIDLTASDDETTPVSHSHPSSIAFRPSPSPLYAPSAHGLFYGSHAALATGHNSFSSRSRQEVTLTTTSPSYIRKAKHRGRRKQLKQRSQYVGSQEYGVDSERSAKRQRIGESDPGSQSVRVPFKAAGPQSHNASVDDVDSSNHLQDDNSGLQSLGPGEISNRTTVSYDQVSGILRKHVYPHVKNALRPYNLDTEVDRSIGKEACKLICDKDFLNEMQELGENVSGLLEGQISLKAKRFVEDLVKKRFPREDTNKALPEPKVQEEIEQPLSPSPAPESESNASARHSSPSTSFTSEGHAPEVPVPVAPVSPSKNLRQKPQAPDYRPWFKQQKDKDKDMPGRADPGSKDQVRSQTEKSEIEAPRKFRASESARAAKLKTPPRAPSLPESQISLLRRINKLEAAAGRNEFQRPYLAYGDRQRVTQMVMKTNRTWNTNLSLTISLHVDLTEYELQIFSEALNSIFRNSPRSDHVCPRENIHNLMRGRSRDITRITNTLLKKSSFLIVDTRSEASVVAILQDAAEGKIPATTHMMRLALKPNASTTTTRSSALNQLLLMRSIHGDEGRRRFRPKLTITREDTLARRAEWSDCSGDIVSIMWTPQEDFICGAITHSDELNQQYNKAGNLVYGSATKPDVRSLGNHRIRRPIIKARQKSAQPGERIDNGLMGENKVEHLRENKVNPNALSAMRETQDPWLYSSVTSTAFKDGYFFTGSYDCTVKLWTLESKMECIGEWEHSGRVNFVITSPHHSMVATAADVGVDAIRVYDVGFTDQSPELAPHEVYSGDKANDLYFSRTQDDADWAYHVATIAWGKSPSVEHLLLAGYSPRSYDSSIDSVPDVRAKTGELCLWDVKNGAKVYIAAGKTQNVFEVCWHPFQPIFVAATSPCGDFENNVRTQIRLFSQTKEGAFLVIKTLDCDALDINEITIRPTSRIESYVTASCTNGCTYVWDTAHPARPIHALQHDDSIDELPDDCEREEADEGVRFAAWGKTVERFYTGSSDGVLKAWDVRAPEGEAHVRDVLTLSGGVYAGAFSDDFEKLLIGDATGKIHLLTIDDQLNGNEDDSEDDEETAVPKTPLQLLLQKRNCTTMIRRPIVPHRETLKEDDSNNGLDIAREFLSRNQLVLDPDPYIGVIQGVDYASTNLFRAKLHYNNDPSQKWRKCVRSQAIFRLDGPRTTEAIFDTLPAIMPPSNQEAHSRNQYLEALDHDFAGMSLADRELLAAEDGGVDFDFWPENSSDLDGSVDFREDLASDIEDRVIDSDSR